eukprot:TRINITY_DN41238_c0_g1_i1.p1 TRINITY_DN41238_c0_g1~~TRINITY_DN41238_c0_g1_i1.p1  ORF type:complete len:336 (-),score=84.91 TRINITY_DN41238_c0_g1_i1:8-1015(-)
MAAEDNFAFKVEGKEVRLADLVKRKQTWLEEKTDAALGRRGNVKDLNDKLRIFDRNDREQWMHKYAHFSGRHMKSNGYEAFCRAQHDPFNKGPQWGDALLLSILAGCRQAGISAEELFNAADVSKDGELAADEMRKILLSVNDKLSDAEVAYIFASLDQDKDGQVSAAEFCSMVNGASKKTGQPPVVHRNPVPVTPRILPQLRDVALNMVYDSEYYDKPLRLPSIEEQDLLCQEAAAVSQRQGKTAPERSRYQTYGGVVGGVDCERIERAKQRQRARREDLCEDEAVLAHLTSSSFNKTQQRFVWDKIRRRKAVAETPRARNTCAVNTCPWQSVR